MMIGIDLTDVIYLDNAQSVKKRVLIEMDSVDMMVAYNVRLPKIAGLQV